ncbi:hypothetical protein C7M84_007138 [Penaeus vannamei]|uniref:Uncharacterized protein n=1 Tax=Penaeus vannamei TaxID=6689 RepID=A0A3R7M7R0_PENVA|nr:hypothetical protein C7M84_007138 [Penaeus vannamei]
MVTSRHCKTTGDSLHRLQRAMMVTSLQTQVRHDVYRSRSFANTGHVIGKRSEVIVYRSRHCKHGEADRLPGHVIANTGDWMIVYRVTSLQTQGEAHIVRTVRSHGHCNPRGEVSSTQVASLQTQGEAHRLQVTSLQNTGELSSVTGHVVIAKQVRMIVYRSRHCKQVTSLQTQVRLIGLGHRHSHRTQVRMIVYHGGQRHLQTTVTVIANSKVMLIVCRSRHWKHRSRHCKHEVGSCVYRSRPCKPGGRGSSSDRSGSDRHCKQGEAHRVYRSRSCTNHCITQGGTSFYPGHVIATTQVGRAQCVYRCTSIAKHSRMIVYSHVIANTGEAHRLQVTSIANTGEAHRPQVTSLQTQVRLIVTGHVIANTGEAHRPQVTSLANTGEAHRLQVTSLQTQVEADRLQVTSLQTQVTSLQTQVRIIVYSHVIANTGEDDRLQVTSLQTQVTSLQTQVRLIVYRSRHCNTIEVTSLQTQGVTSLQTQVRMIVTGHVIANTGEDDRLQVTSLQTQVRDHRPQVTSLQTQVRMIVYRSSATQMSTGHVIANTGEADVYRFHVIANTGEGCLQVSHCKPRSTGCHRLQVTFKHRSVIANTGEGSSSTGHVIATQVGFIVYRSVIGNTCGDHPTGHRHCKTHRLQVTSLQTQVRALQVLQVIVIVIATQVTSLQTTGEAHRLQVNVIATQVRLIVYRSRHCKQQVRLIVYRSRHCKHR